MSRPLSAADADTLVLTGAANTPTDPAADGTFVCRWCGAVAAPGGELPCGPDRWGVLARLWTWQHPPSPLLEPVEQQDLIDRIVQEDPRA